MGAPSLIVALMLGMNLAAEPTIPDRTSNFDPCEGAPTLCRRAAQAHILAWRKRALDAEADLRNAQGMVLKLTSTSTKGSAPGPQLVAAEVDRRVDAEEEGMGFWSGVLIGGGVSALAGGLLVAAILLGQ